MSTQPTWDNSAGGQAPASSRTNGLAVAALVTGIIALLISWIPGLNLLGALLAIAAVVTGIIGMRNAARPGVGGKGMALTGLITGVLALLVTIAFYTFLASVLNNPEVQQQLEQIQSEAEQTPGG